MATSYHEIIPRRGGEIGENVQDTQIKVACAEKIKVACAGKSHSRCHRDIGGSCFKSVLLECAPSP